MVARMPAPGPVVQPNSFEGMFTPILSPTPAIQIQNIKPQNINPAWNPTKSGTTGDSVTAAPSTVIAIFWTLA
jgi:hypothetical protein